MGEGILPILFRFNKTDTILKLKNVQFVPEANENVISVNRFNIQFKTSLILNIKSGFLIHRKLKSKIANIDVRNNTYSVTGFVIGKNQSKYSPCVLNNSLKCCSIDINELDVLRIPTASVQNSAISNAENKHNGNPVCLKTKSVKRKKSKKLTSQQIEKLILLGDYWHRRMGHISASYIHKLSKVANGVDEVMCKASVKTCDVCAASKLTRKVFDKDRDSAERVGQIVHADLIGPIYPPTFYTKKCYILCIIDDYSRFLQLFVLYKKDQTSAALFISVR